MRYLPVMRSSIPKPPIATTSCNVGYGYLTFRTVWRKACLQGARPLVRRNMRLSITLPEGSMTMAFQIVIGAPAAERWYGAGGETSYQVAGSLPRVIN
jgi:hypothetical protein